MKRRQRLLVLSGALLIGAGALPLLEAGTGAAVAAERTVVLTLETLLGESPASAFTLYRALYAVDGVAAVDISMRTGTAIVIYDDARTGIADIVQATTEAGFPSEAAE